MKRSTSFALLAALALSPLAQPAGAQMLRTPETAAPAAPSELAKRLSTVTSVPELERLASGYASKNDLDSLATTIERLVALRPGNGNYLYTLSATYAQQGKKKETYDALIRLQTSGYAFDPTNDPRFTKVHGTEVWDYLLMNLTANGKPFGEGRISHTLPAGDYLFESLGYDPAKQQLLVGSAREGKIYRVDGKGAITPLVSADSSNGMWAVTDFVVDAPRNAIYVASTAIPHFKGVDTADYGKAAVFRFALDTGRFEKKFAVDAAPGAKVNLSSVAVTPEGRLFAADGLARALYRLEGDALKPFLANQALTAIRGLAASDKAIYFTDYDLGVFGVDLKTGDPFEVKIPPSLTLYGITGIAYWNGHLVVSQNGFPPKRIMRLKLSADGRTVESSQALAAAQPEFTELTRGAMGGDTYYTIANSQRKKYDRFGLPRTGETLDAVKVYGASAKFALGQAGESRPAPMLPK